MPQKTPREIVKSAKPSTASPDRVQTRFQAALASGAKLLPLGTAKKRPRRLLQLGYEPRYLLELFDAAFYLSGPWQNEDMRFFVAYVCLGGADASDGRIHPRIFYKDVSLVWRAASHFVRSDYENWLGKGDLKPSLVDGEVVHYTDEATTDLPLEIQTALENLSRVEGKPPYDDRALGLVLRRAPDDRSEPYSEFSAPRARAAAIPGNLVNGGRKVARFTRKNDPTSLRFTRGYEPDFGKGVIERSQSFSQLYGGRVRRFRILSANREIQYLFFAGKTQVWIGSVQPTSTGLSSFGVRTLDVEIDDDALLPAFEYHFMDEDLDPPEMHTQIPPGFVGEPSPRDPYRCDTSPWLDKMPVVREFRRKLLRR